jgi:molecular chaperone DnaK
MNGDDIDAIRSATESLGATIQKIGAAAYQQAGPSTPPPAGDQPPEGEGGGPSGPQSGGGEDVVDGEFKQV